MLQLLDHNDDSVSWIRSVDLQGTTHDKT